MLDGHFKTHQDAFWNRLGRVLARWGLTPNQVTWIGVGASLLNSAAYLLHRDPLLFGILMAVTELLDDLDGAVARVTDHATHDGAYLDAVTDRYKETAALAALGHVHQAWPLAFAALAGSLITSYNKARAGMEVPIDNARWPDLFERFERVALLVVALVAQRFVDPEALWGRSPVEAVLIVLAVGTGLSSLQRLRRARAILRAHDAP